MSNLAINYIYFFFIYCILKVRKTFYHPQTKLREGNVFTAVCDSVHRGPVERAVCKTKGGLCGKGAVHGEGVSMVKGVHDEGGPYVSKGCAWQGGHVCVTGGYAWLGRHVWKGRGTCMQDKRLLKQAVHILLENILVYFNFIKHDRFK